MGAKSQEIGKSFEDLFFRSCQLRSVGITRIPDSCRQLRNRIIRVKSPFDWILTYFAKSAFIDTKTTQESTFAHSDIDSDQVIHLSTQANCGAIAGYVIWYRKINIVSFIHVKHLRSAIGVRGSFKPDHPLTTYLGTSAFDIRRIF